MPIKLFDKCWYVVAKHRTGDDQDLGYMTQVDSGLKAKVSTGCSWARVDISQDSGVFFDNKPTSGFYIGDSVARYSTSNKLFRVRDPRGFVVEVPTGNIATLLHLTTVKNGVVQEDCVWGREGNNHILLPVNSQPYLDAVQHTKKTVDLVKMSTIKKGDVVTLMYQGFIIENAIYVGRDDVKWRYDVHELTGDDRHSIKMTDKVLNSVKFSEKRRSHLFMYKHPGGASLVSAVKPNVHEVTGHVNVIPSMEVGRWYMETDTRDWIDKQPGTIELRNLNHNHSMYNRFNYGPTGPTQIIASKIYLEEQ